LISRLAHPLFEATDSVFEREREKRDEIQVTFSYSEEVETLKFLFFQTFSLKEILKS
jgi:hypothetical protein